MWCANIVHAYLSGIPQAKQNESAQAKQEQPKASAKVQWELLPSATEDKNLISLRIRF
jgi:hypothetical protein